MTISWWPRVTLGWEKCEHLARGSVRLRGEMDIHLAAARVLRTRTESSQPSLCILFVVDNLDLFSDSQVQQNSLSSTGNGQHVYLSVQSFDAFTSTSLSLCDTQAT